MLGLLMRLGVWVATGWFRLRRFFPTNQLLDWLQTRAGLRYGLPAMGLVVPYLALALLAQAVLETGGPEWLKLAAGVCAWNALKFALFGPFSVIKLTVVRLRERQAWRRVCQRGLVTGA